MKHVRRDVACDAYINKILVIFLEFEYHHDASV